MVHAMDQNLLSLVQQELKKLIEEFSRVNSKLALQSKRRSHVEETVAVLQDQPFCKRARLDEHDPAEEKLQKSNHTSKEEIEMIITKLVSVEKVLNEGLASTSIKVNEMEQWLTKTSAKVVQLQQEFSKRNDKVEQLEQRVVKTYDKVKLEQEFAKTDDKVEQLDQKFAKTDDKLEQLEQEFAKTDGKVEQLEQGFARADAKAERLEQRFTNTDDQVKQLERDLLSQNEKEKKPGMLLFDTSINKSII